MTFMQIIVLVLVAVLILTILFALFHIFIALLPVGIVAAVIIWVMYLFTKKKNKDNMPSSGNFSDPFKQEDESERSSKRKKARNVKTKDVDK